MQAHSKQSVSFPLECDVLVVGGGINGAGIARDAAGRGLSVALCEQHDLAAHTSSSSSKLIHGGLRYLEHYEFGLVRKALIEREVLLRSAPHIMWPLRFVMPHDRGQRPAWLIRLGMFLYDHLARRELLPGSRGLDLRRHASGAPLKPEFTRGFVYSDGWVDDARLVVLNAMDAAENGARIFTRTRCESIVRQGEQWQASLRQADGHLLQLRARCVVNASGPWVAQFLGESAHVRSSKSVRLVKGSHIVVRRLFEHDHAYIFQNPDGRIVFAIPYERDFTLIGTTDVEYRGATENVAISADEIAYLCTLSNRYFSKPIAPADVVWSYAGVRPLLEDAAADASAVTRDYQLDLNREGAPLLSVFGGKITTFRKLAEEAVDMIAPLLGNNRAAWTAGACLPGGDLFGALPENRSVREFDGFVQGLQAQYAWLPPQLLRRYARAYGSRTHTLLKGRGKLEEMGEEILAGLYAAEVDYLVRHEWATCAADILWRRSKLGLHLPKGSETVLDGWLAAPGGRRSEQDADQDALQAASR
ncbi:MULTISPECIES: glycerol-3-phosphate dehydrogenase [unclassified Herbaspirillum]|uniref:glycerol-3-phosphate dehydrogenase n=1 Tax=unclassified Herbaspirillum TaxID=2624150 RepID=UPI00114EA2C1|nr:MULTISPECIES: glycerol-3-phosphate dehydrogenase [unclassified Herbaspirillum]MBB5389862.1 glycerol-3-phosphate dehydrogenase [Herbaspirillum sp. SJZ102]TQK09625.1 homodimeric glycerol 3-phosphate dehydrogenase (quinone) [Herbaspirillum sp. SJZ130]TQK13688.1 homodimeric glycerol 3-phosphate dehydrogenase (quinone) [Herbaspirillum sp. SJZ106]